MSQFTRWELQALYGMLSVLAEYQRELIIANTNDGPAAAQARGGVGGRTTARWPKPSRIALTAHKTQRPHQDRPRFA
ncbi:recombinase family protein [Tenggerimyces flavus]|uniref:Resolvase/invertase-type recombinase catalytic domain-containing protein n=1 Tax=Tenggerimyces flavus TaxID=1708749 RepID=A0ABV7Y6M3_9ACTN|nr:hypothetical protein [Tenggerimyces flavus]MBM7790351.1 DNA invertase Pin-like site-specific DNA recombinase [Tenggerimyces flavus]